MSFLETDIEFRIISATNFNGNAYQVLSMVSKSKIEFASTESCHLIRSQFSSKQRCMCCTLSPGPVVQPVWCATSCTSCSPSYDVQQVCGEEVGTTACWNHDQAELRRRRLNQIKQCAPSWHSVSYARLDKERQVWTGLGPSRLVSNLSFCSTSHLFRNLCKTLPVP